MTSVPFAAVPRIVCLVLELLNQVSWLQWQNREITPERNPPKRQNLGKEDFNPNPKPTLAITN